MSGPVPVSLLFLLLTLGLFYANRALHRRLPSIWLTPAIATSALLIALVELTDTPFPLYFGETRWLAWLLGPATVAFALPIYQYRELVRRHWLALTLGSCAGIAASLASTLLLDRLLGLHGSTAQSLLARSVSTPFALEATRHLGGDAQLTGVFVIITGLFGIALGQLLLGLLPLRMRIARGGPRFRPERGAPDRPAGRRGRQPDHDFQRHPDGAAGADAGSPAGILVGELSAPGVSHQERPPGIGG